SSAVGGALRNSTNLRFPNARAQVVTDAAAAGGQEGRSRWGRHRNGGFGWAGPLYWPYAYHDISDYALWGDGYDDSFWDYGYSDIYAGMFTPYADDDVAGYRPQKAGPGGAPQADDRPHAAIASRPHTA